MGIMEQKMQEQMEGSMYNELLKGYERLKKENEQLKQRSEIVPHDTVVMRWNYEMKDCPEDEVVWLAMQHRYGPNEDNYVVTGFIDGNKYYADNGDLIDGKPIAWMKYAIPEFPNA